MPRFKGRVPPSTRLCPVCHKPVVRGIYINGVWWHRFCYESRPLRYRKR